jgi:hypothetical protein
MTCPSQYEIKRFVEIFEKLATFPAQVTAGMSAMPR